MSITEEELKTKLKDYIITRAKYPHIHPSLDGEILLEEHRDEIGNLKGVITIRPEELAGILNMRDDPSLRPDIVIEMGKFKGRRLRDLTADEFEENSGHKKYLDRWRADGIIL